MAGHPGAVVGEIGLDRWILDQTPAVRVRHAPSLAGKQPAAMAVQEETFVWQLRFAAERNLPVTIHCLQAWGRLHDLLRANPRPEAGFLLHSYGGPVEMIEGLAKLGAYFGFPGYFANEAKARQCEVFRHVPADRLLVETDAPDQLPPASLVTHPLPAAGGRPAPNHPANLGAIQGFLAAKLGVPPAEFAGQIAANFARLFG
jgi:TatD DNase family protein